MRMRQRQRQRGWALLIVLVALAIVGYLARDALLRYAGARSQATGDAASPSPAPSDAAQTLSTPASAVERARAVEAIVLERAEQAARRIDATR